MVKLVNNIHIKIYELLFKWSFMIPIQLHKSGLLLKFVVDFVFYGKL